MSVMRFVMGVLGLSLGYLWTLALVYYLFAQPDWGADTQGFRRGLVIALLVSAYGTKWLLGRFALDLPFLRLRAFYVTLALGVAGTMLAYVVDMYNRHGTLTDYPVVLGWIFDLLTLVLMWRMWYLATTIALGWEQS